MTLASNGTPRLLWTHPNRGATNMETFRRHINKTYGSPQHQIETYKDLHSWSIDPISAADFWRELFLFENLKAGTIPKRVIDAKFDQNLMYPPPKFFPDVYMNFAEHILSDKPDDQVAVIACGEGGTHIQRKTFAQLRSRVEIVADALISAGVETGDRVAAVISNCLETIEICLATLSIGAIWSTSSPDMGVAGIVERMVQIKPKVVFFEDSVLYNGKVRDLTDKYTECFATFASFPEFEKGVVIPRHTFTSIAKGSKTQTWDNFLNLGVGRSLTFAQLPFSHPGFIVYSSGTTGAPKCIVHSACGLLMQVKKDYMLHLDVKPGDVIYQYTTTGWIMWAMVLCGLSYGGTILMYDGSPLLPDPMITLRLAAQFRVSLFGTSARFLSDLKQINARPREIVDLSNLRTVSSTGSVLTADVCEWFYDKAFPWHVHLASGSGGTDLACALVLGEPTSPLYSGEIQAPALGMAVDVLDATSSTVISIRKTGQSGELVCRRPFPSQPVMFWGSKGDERYHSAYFQRYGPGVWQQGDFVSVSPITEGYTMLGRS